MPSLQIRKLPPDIYESLAHRAEREGRSLAQQAIVELRKLPELEARKRRLETLEAIKERLRTNPATGVLDPAPEDLIREDRSR